MSIGLHLPSGVLTSIFYADDLVIFAENRDSLSRALKSLEAYATLNHLLINPSKTQIIKFFRSTAVMPVNDIFTVCNTNITCSTTVKYLGLELNSVLSNKNMFTNAINHTKRSLAVLHSLFPFCSDLPPKTLKMLYYSYVISMLSYGGPLWAYNLGTLPDFDCTFLKKIYRLPLNTSHCLIRKEFFLDPPKICLYIQQFKYLCRISNITNTYLDDVIKILLYYPSLYAHPLRSLKKELHKLNLDYFLSDTTALNASNLDCLYNLLIEQHKCSVTTEVISHYCYSHFLGTVCFNYSLDYWFLPSSCRRTMMLLHTNSLLKPIDSYGSGVFCCFCGERFKNCESLLFHILLKCTTGKIELLIPNIDELDLIRTLLCDFSSFNSLDVPKSILHICNSIRSIYIPYTV